MRTFIAVMALTGTLGLAAGAGTPLSAAPADVAQSQGRFRARVSDQQIRSILARIRTSSQTIIRGIDGEPPRGRVWGNQSRRADDVVYLVEDLQTATTHLEDHLSRQLVVRADVDDLLRRAAAVDEAFARQAPNANVRQTWTNARRDIDSLASAYSLSFDWQNPQYSNDPVTGVYRELDGTYAIVPAQSESAPTVINNAVRNLPAGDRERATRQLANRLDPPDRIAIDRTGQRIVIASTRGPQLTFEADGSPRTETGPGGATITTRASVYGDQLDVTTVGMANQEFGVTFEPLTGGRELRVTRTVYADSLTRPVTLRTVYRKTSDVPDWDLYNNAGSNTGTGTAVPRPGRSSAGPLVPDGVTLTAALDETVNLQTAREDDRITLTIRNAPRPELEGARIYGTISTAPTRDNARLALQFDEIRLANGRNSAFDGVIERVVAPNGRAVRFDGEVTSVDRNGPDAVTRGAIGAGIGALIGALAGGGKGAIIGAAIGGGGAAATVLLDDPSQPQLLRGTQFTIRSRNR
jgi:hypothetical protein